MADIRVEEPSGLPSQGRIVESSAVLSDWNPTNHNVTVSFGAVFWMLSA